MTLVRDMTAADLEAVGFLAERLVLLHHSWDQTRFFTTPGVADGYRRFFQSILEDPSQLLLVAERNGEAAGYVFGSLERRDWAKLLDAHGAIHDIYVADAHRRNGVSKALMEEAKKRFAAKGAKQLVLYSASANVEGQTLFRSLGYRPTMVEFTLDL